MESKSIKNISGEREKQLKDSIDELRKMIRSGEEKNQIVDKLQSVFSKGAKLKSPPKELTDLLDEIFDSYPYKDPHKNEDYLSFLRSSMAKSTFDHSWIKDYYRSYKPNTLTDLTIKLIENQENEMVLDLMVKFHEDAFKVDGFIDTLQFKRLHEEFALNLKQKLLKVEDLSEFFKNPKNSIEVYRTYVNTYESGKKIWPVELGKNRVNINIERYRPNSKIYVDALKDKYSDTYRVLYSQEAFFYLSPSLKSRQVEAISKISCLFFSIEFFIKKMIKIPVDFSIEKDRPDMGDFISYLEKDPTKLTKNWRKYYWKSSYIHKNTLDKLGKKYSLLEGLKQYADWTRGDIRTSLASWEFAQQVVHPFTYELLCDLMDAFGCVKQ